MSEEWAGYHVGTIYCCPVCCEWKNGAHRPVETRLAPCEECASAKLPEEVGTANTAEEYAAFLAEHVGVTLRCVNCGGYEDASIDPDGCVCDGDFKVEWAKPGPAIVWEPFNNSRAGRRCDWCDATATRKHAYTVDDVYTGARSVRAEWACEAHAS